MDDTVDFAVYTALIFLTAVTLAVSFLHGGRLLAVSLALIVAGAKAGLIAYYYMGLSHERGWAWAILGIGGLALAALLAGILPDMTFARL